MIYPVSLLRLAMGAAEGALDTLAVTGSFQKCVPQMQHRARLYELIDYSGYNTFDEAVFTYQADPAASMAIS